MKPLKKEQFRESNIVFAENQPQYIPLPAWKNSSENGEVVTIWKATIQERLKILFSGKIYLTVLTFNQPMTPNRIYAYNPIPYYDKGENTPISWNLSLRQKIWFWVEDRRILYGLYSKRQKKRFAKNLKEAFGQNNEPYK